jgi:hypothetical protein
MDKIIISLIQMEQQLRIFHWQTKSYARHQAFGATYDTLSGLIDKYVEICMGKHDRFILDESCSLELKNLQELKPIEFCNACCEMLIGISAILDPSCDSDLMNIRDEMLAEVNKLKYLLTLQ